MTDTAQTLIDELDELLENERSALLLGDLDRITVLLALKESLIDRLSEIDHRESQPLDDLQTKIKRNQTLLDGALQGIRRASARMAALRRVRKSLDTYNQDGQKQTIEGQVIHKVEKRA